MSIPAITFTARAFPVYSYDANGRAERVVGQTTTAKPVKLGRWADGTLRVFNLSGHTVYEVDCPRASAAEYVRRTWISYLSQPAR